MGNPDWKTSFDTFSVRKANEDELDRLIGEWAKDYTAEQVMEMLQENAVPAGVVQSGFDLWEDPQIQHRAFFQWLDHRECGPMPYEGIPFTLSKTPGKLRWPQPCLGEHNAYILKEFVGMSDEEIGDLVVTGVLEVT